MRMSCVTSKRALEFSAMRIRISRGVTLLRPMKFSKFCMSVKPCGSMRRTASVQCRRAWDMDLEILSRSRYSKDRESCAPGGMSSRIASLAAIMSGARNRGLEVPGTPVEALVEAAAAVDALLVVAACAVAGGESSGRLSTMAQNSSVFCSNQRKSCVSW